MVYYSIQVNRRNRARIVWPVLCLLNPCLVHAVLAYEPCHLCLKLHCPGGRVVHSHKVTRRSRRSRLRKPVSESMTWRRRVVMSTRWSGSARRGEANAMPGVHGPCAAPIHCTAARVCFPTKRDGQSVRLCTASTSNSCRAMIYSGTRICDRNAVEPRSQKGRNREEKKAYLSLDRGRRFGGHFL